MKRNLLFSQLTAIGKRLAMVLTMLLIVGVGSVWGATETITAANGVYSGSGDNAIHTWTLTSCTVIQAKGNGTAVNKSYPNRWYQNNLITFTPKSGYTITKIVLTGSSSSYHGQTMKATMGTISSSSNTTTWTGNITSSSSVTLTMGKQFRFGSVTITYSSSGGGGSTTVDPEVTFSNGEYTVGGAALDLSTLWESNSTGAVTYSVTNANGTGATISGTSFTATAAGSCTVQATQAKTASHNAITKTATITVTAPVGDGDGDCYKWVEVELSEIKPDDEVVIAMVKSNSIYALTYNSETATSKAPPATLITSDDLKTKSGIANTLRWNISNSNETLTIYPTGVTNKWLYCTNDNNGVRVGTNTNKTFKISGNYLQHTNTSRYVGVYTTNPDWRCYTSTTSSNIARQTLKFYKYVECIAETTRYSKRLTCPWFRAKQ